MGLSVLVVSDNRLELNKGGLFYCLWEMKYIGYMRLESAAIAYEDLKDRLDAVIIDAGPLHEGVALVARLQRVSRHEGILILDAGCEGAVEIVCGTIIPRNAKALKAALKRIGDAT